MPKYSILSYLRQCLGQALWSWVSPSLSSDKNPSTCPSFLMDAQSWFHAHLHDAYGSGFPTTLRAPAECCPSLLIIFGEFTGSQGSCCRQGGMQRSGGVWLRWVPSMCSAWGGLKSWELNWKGSRWPPS